MNFKSQSSNFQTDVEKILSEFKSATGDQLPELRTRLEDALQAARDTSSTVMDSAKDAFRGFAGLATDNYKTSRDACCDYIGKNPMRSAAIIGAAGLLLGAMMRRR